LLSWSVSIRAGSRPDGALIVDPRTDQATRISARLPAGRRWRGSRRPRSLLAAKRWIRRHVFGCLLDREWSGSPLSPQSLPMRLDPEGSRFRIGPHSVPLEFLPVPERAGSALRNPDSRRDTCSAAGTRWEPGRNPSGTCGAYQEVAARRCRASTAAASPLGGPVPNRVHHPYKGVRWPPKRDALKGENAGSLRGVQVRRCGEGA
jgi:hypothetical protein